MGVVCPKDRPETKADKDRTAQLVEQDRDKRNAPKVYNPHYVCSGTSLCNQPGTKAKPKKSGGGAGSISLDDLPGVREAADAGKAVGRQANTVGTNVAREVQATVVQAATGISNLYTRNLKPSPCNGGMWMPGDKPCVFGLQPGEASSRDPNVLRDNVTDLAAIPFGRRGGGGGKIGLTRADEMRIQGVANKTNQRVTVVGSRAGGTARPDSDYDYILSGNSRQRQKARKLLPRGSAGGEITGSGKESGIDAFQDFNPGAPDYTELDVTRPHSIFEPQG